MTPAGHLLTGYLAGAALGKGSDRRWVVAAALIGSIAPDFDVALGLLGGWAGAGLHRGATHSFVGAVAMAAVVALAARRHFRPIFLACLAGILTHIFWDWLNPWGVVALWPWMRPFRGNLLHEGDVYAIAIVTLPAVLMRAGGRRAAAVTLALLLPAYLLLQLWWRDRAASLASRDLHGRRVAVYPTPQITCGWIAVSAGPDDMSVHCFPSPLGPLRLARRVPTREDVFTRASSQSAAVREFREKIPFPFAEVFPAADGGALVLWRDLREAYQQEPGEPPTGLHVHVDAAGRIVGERHRWWLSLW